MAKVTFRSDIENISGKVGNLVCRTFTRRDGSKETRVYQLPVKDYNRQGHRRYGYTRRTKVSDAELEARRKFTVAQAALRQLTDEQLESYKSEWVKARYKFNGKKYATLRGYICARIYAEMNNSENSNNTVI